MDGPIRRAAIVEDDDKSPTKEEMAREISTLKKCLKEAHVIILKRNEQMQEERGDGQGTLATRGQTLCRKVKS